MEQTTEQKQKQQKQKSGSFVFYLIIGVGVAFLLCFLAYLIPIIYKWLFGYFAFTELLKFISEMKNGKKKKTSLWDKVADLKEKNKKEIHG